MKRILMTAVVTLLIPGAVHAAGYGLEADRVEAGRKFDEQQFSSPLAVQITGGVQRGADAKCNAEARDYSKLEAKAPPAPKAVPAEGGEEGPQAPAEDGAMMSGISGEKGAVILPVAAIFVLLVLGGGMLLAAGAMAAVAIAACSAEAPAKPEKLCKEGL